MLELYSSSDILRFGDLPIIEPPGERPPLLKLEFSPFFLFRVFLLVKAGLVLGVDLDP